MKFKTACRSCGKADLEEILCLGRTPLANSLLTLDELDKPEPTYQLDLAFCPNCKLVQIIETVPSEKLFREYFYFSSFSDTMLQHSRNLVERLVQLRNLNGRSQIIEIASNDGYLLQYYKQRGIPVLGIEPAANIAKVAQEEHGVPTLCEFFGIELAQKLSAKSEQADVIHAHNVLAHVPDLNGFVAGIGLLLKEDGVAVIEVPYLRDMSDHCEFDTIYHEHLCYFSLTALDCLFRGNGLIVQDVERIPIHGGSLRLFVARDGSAIPTEAVQDLLNDEAGLGMGDIEFYQGFAQKVEDLKASLRRTLLELKQQRKRIAAYGAAAKGSTLLNFFGIGDDILDFVVDRSRVKQSRFMPGVHLPIYSPEKLLEDMPDYVLLLTWNFEEEILAQQKEYLRRGGHFIIPVPEVKII